jgi:ubiquilin
VNVNINYFSLDGGAGNMFSAFGLPNMGGLGLGGGPVAEMHQRFQQELMSNPEAMRQVLDSPFVQQIMNSPDVIRTMLNANPQIQQLMEVSRFEFCRARSYS